MKIFVSVASYRDKELVKTLNSLVDHARFKRNLVVSVFNQEDPRRLPDLSFVPNLNHMTTHFKNAKGAGWARKQLMETYNGEDFFFQIDSHMRFAENWDVRLMTMYEQVAEMTGNKKIILSQFPAPYKLFTNGKEHYPIDDPYFWDQPSWTSVVRTTHNVWAGNREVMSDFSKPHRSHTVLAGYVFAPGNLVEEVPYDDRISFMGEELCFAIRAFTRHWEIYAPHEMLLWHYYTRKEYPKIWSNADNVARPVEYKWTEMEKRSIEVQKHVLTGVERGIYGIGDEQRYLEYQEMIGINFKQFYHSLESDKAHK